MGHDGFLPKNRPSQGPRLHLVWSGKPLGRDLGRPWLSLGVLEPAWAWPDHKKGALDLSKEGAECQKRVTEEPGPLPGRGTQ